MSSWVSHLPSDVSYAEVIGHGMNDMPNLPQIRGLVAGSFWILNRNPRLLLCDSSVDAAMICVSIQYRQQPVAVLREVARNPSNLASLSSSASRTAAFSDQGRSASRRRSMMRGMHSWVTLYSRRAGFADIETKILCDGRASDPLTVVVAAVGHAYPG